MAVFDRFSRIAVASALVLVLMIAASCGGSNDDTVSDTEQPEALTLASSGARWLGGDVPSTERSLDEFDVSLIKSDPQVVGVEVWWDFAQTDPDDFLTVNAQVETSIEGELISFGRGGPAARGSNERVVQDGPLRIEPIDDGVRVAYRFEPRGVSDLFDDDGNPIALAGFELSVDFEAGTGGISSIDFLEDEGDDGELDYEIELTISASGSTLTEPFSFTATESDPGVEAIENDQAALAAVTEADIVSAADQAECTLVIVSVVDGVAETGPAGEAPTFSVALPEGWSAEARVRNDPCTPGSIEVESPSASSSREDIAVVVQLAATFGETPEQRAASYVESANVRYDGETEIALQLGDDEYTEFTDPEQVTLWGLTGVRFADRIVDSELTTQLYVLDAGDFLLELRYGSWGTDLEAELFSTFVDAATANAG